MSSTAIDTSHGHHGEHHSRGFVAWCLRWITTTNHKEIGTLYLVWSLLMLFVGGGMAMVIRAELLQPGMQFVRPEFFNSMTTVHALVMVFAMIMPAFAGFANWMIPLMIGAPDMALPRLNNWSFWLLPFAVGLLLLTFIMPGGAPAGGWMMVRQDSHDEDEHEEHAPVSIATAGAYVAPAPASDTGRPPIQPDLARVARGRTLGGFALSLAHELNQPLSAILSNAQAARRFLASPNPPIDEVRAIIDDIDADDRRAGELIHGMRALLNQHDVEMARIDLNHVVRDAARLVHGDCLLRRVALVLDLEAPLPPVRCDRVQIEQVLLNLIVNGFEAMQDTGAVDRRMIIRSRSDAAGGRCVISVRDAGTGIPPASFERLFDQFFSTKPEGLGMGLSIARSIANAHGGTIWATNNTDQGATFHLALPIAPEQEEA